MNWKKLTIGLTAVNVLAWVLLEIWSKRYADTNIEAGAGFFVGLHLAGYYIVAIGSRLPSTPPDKVTPVNCPGHDWQTDKYSSPHHKSEKCVKCGAERGVNSM